MTLASVLAIATLVLGVPLNLYVTVKLRRLYRASPRTKVLREREIVAAAILLLAVVFGLVFVNNDMSTPVLAGDVTKVITRAVVLAVAVVPALYWMFLYGDAG